MDIKTIAVTYHRKFNLGDYESLELGCSLWAQIDPEEDAEGVTQFLYQQAKASVKEAARPVIQDSIHQMNKARMQRQSTKNQTETELDDF
ncbi:MULTISPECIES: hypothetical protein [unclassified Tolypothrix]|uniref:hypothetical protein n=1 Tax=unclassified Tolypothrix TaxID=2649714 RepID=UPI0005EABD1D|nr:MULTISPECIES: hypothetical protein [unclassified Tolypothrix]BAY95265.1 hypothetical protein NIES3275_73220 [Microchaete diplosiphon NIES-3275]EKE98261.1 hypothetical protein FDUTEX481_04155 [Tolypothrix sp. PCC 7601]MBE9086916.1 hypothetical protein [Tolypothrix sp. LEGE 11397]UYD30488.1 hypothetical protein HGR01_37270 [Tolypothrix sp. PCC 7712]UYD38378.1 hypothetical protein HG267_37625 [Tolypothrix sp. PCC 7601]